MGTIVLLGVAAAVEAGVGVALGPAGVGLALVGVGLKAAVVAVALGPAGVGLALVGVAVALGPAGVGLAPAGVGLANTGEAVGAPVAVAAGVADDVVSGAGASGGPGDSNGGAKPNNCCNSGSAS